MKIFTKIFGTRNEKLIRQMMPIVNRINELEKTVVSLSAEELISNSNSLQERVAKGESLDSVLPEAYALCREASKRALGQRHYDVQLLGGIVLHQGQIAEMRTGEGKTLTATLPAYLHGLTGKGTHVVTVNDYLAKRDAEWMSAIYNTLGMSAGVIVNGLTDGQRQTSYNANITYGTNNEFGFDYLRDNMKTDPQRLVQVRGHHFAIVDEVDSILIDEARTPLIISGPADTDTDLYRKVNAVIPGLQKDSDYTVDEKSRSVELTEDGISKMEKRLRLDNLYDPRHISWLHHIQQSLKAHVIFKKDVDYVVRNNEVIIVDEFTGRLMPGRRYSDGLHGALEAKEHVSVQHETQTLATITFQNYFRLYDVLSGMTGTADTEAVEFKKIYGLDVVVLPTNKKIVREDVEDMIFRSTREKFVAIATDIEEAQKKGQPILVGTVSVEKSELLSHLLQSKSIPHEVLNAKNHAREAAIIADAGKRGHVTIATNMAGRGTDIVLGEGVKEVGGLYVIGTERHESRRIDNQLRGRSGRQGDPGKSKFFLSLEDDLMRIFASDRLSSIMGRLGMQEGESIVSPMVTRAIEKAQRRVEEQNFSSRKNLLEYDDVMNQQRQVVYARRRNALLNHQQLNFKEQAIHKILTGIVEKCSPMALNSETWDFQSILTDSEREFQIKFSLPSQETFTVISVELIVEKLATQVLKHYEEKVRILSSEQMQLIENFIYLQVIDQAWKEHLLAMDALKDSVRLRGYGQRDPLQEYKKEAFILFSQMMYRIEEESTLAIIRMPMPTEAEKEEMLKSLAEVREDEDDISDLTFSHPDASPAVLDASQTDQVVEEDSSLIYHGSPSLMGGEKKAIPAGQTIKREAKKVGRNDSCPCGSGKKYKKCHGIGMADVE